MGIKVLRSFLLTIAAMVILWPIGLIAWIYLSFILPGPPVDYQLPKSAKVIEEKASPSGDFFGEFCYSAVLKLPSAEIKNLMSKGFDWVTSDISIEKQPKWITGKLTSEILRRIRDHGCELTDSLDSKKTYKYLYSGSDYKFRLFVLDGKQDNIYYYRNNFSVTEINTYPHNMK
jgi:hypothetical protein